MKLSTTLLLACVSLSCVTSGVHAQNAEYICPTIPTNWNRTSPVEGWAVGSTNIPPLRPGQSWKFYDAWIYNASANQPTKCHYVVAGPGGNTNTKYQLFKGGQNSSNRMFIYYTNTGTIKPDKSTPTSPINYHCLPGNSQAKCAMSQGKMP